MLSEPQERHRREEMPPLFHVYYSFERERDPRVPVSHSEISEMDCEESHTELVARKYPIREYITPADCLRNGTLTTFMLIHFSNLVD
ncbi:hypothetical protein CEXT_357731 [Caerostris extrusa]|uniref:Uncharacterized protein n=1 Tax=Caerostris extrusa TaxID=172846 RepID=A0AAV4NH04_CAEEX|nr:hypothetical protein CEXT_357731 [Caerostris extrusa]